MLTEEGNLKIAKLIVNDVRLCLFSRACFHFWLGLYLSWRVSIYVLLLLHVSIFLLFDSNRKCLPFFSFHFPFELGLSVCLFLLTSSTIVWTKATLCLPGVCVCVSLTLHFAHEDKTSSTIPLIEKTLFVLHRERKWNI